MALSDTKVKLLREIFQVLDRDGSGTISVREFKRLGEAMYEVRTGKKSPPLSKDLVRRQLAMADADGDLELNIDEWLGFSKKLAGMGEAAFVKSFTAYKSALQNRAEGSVSSQGHGSSVKVKQEVKRINKITSAEVSAGQVKRLDTESVDPSQSRHARESKRGVGGGGRGAVDAVQVTADDVPDEEAVGKVGATKVHREKKTKVTADAENAAEEVVSVQKIGKGRGGGS